jgi:tripartite-type tricarboxylate transporter receptor subunit TctC
MRFLAMPCIVIAGVLTIPMVSPLAAQQWPSRAVRLVVPYPAGGNVDGAARIVGNRLQEVLGQPFIVDNKSGAGEAFAKSAPDGYTLFVGSNGPVLFAPEIAKRDAYNWKRDFLPITSVSMTPLVLEVHPMVRPHRHMRSRHRRWSCWWQSGRRWWHWGHRICGWR